MVSDQGDEVFPLELLGSGDVACVVEVLGDAVKVHQLAEIGLRKGCSIRMIRPGQPCLLAIEGRRLSLRLNHEVDILVGTTKLEY
ncbi:MAG: ferrous iron transport protein A [Pirellulaceae bacterium]|nr:ferrous iron transport protein A [Pirellulaceae bacterium]